jgi:hypothetical protein
MLGLLLVRELWTGRYLCPVRFPSEGWSAAEFARTVGDNEVVGPVPLSLDLVWREVLKCHGSVRGTKTFGLQCVEPGGLSPILRNGCACSFCSFLKVLESDLPS